MKSDKTFIIIYTTFPNLNSAKKIINLLIHKKIIACANIFKISSIYRWKGKIEHSAEYGAFIKTKKANYKKLEKLIKQHHPYEVPEIISWSIEKGYKPYLDWIEECVQTKRG